MNTIIMERIWSKTHIFFYTGKKVRLGIIDNVAVQVASIHFIIFIEKPSFYFHY